MSSVEEDDYDTLTDIDSDKNVIRTKVWHRAWPCPAQTVLGEGTLCSSPSVSLGWICKAEGKELSWDRQDRLQEKLAWGHLD